MPENKDCASSLTADPADAKLQDRSVMSDSVIESLILDLLEWLGRQDRSYKETMDAWRTYCPKLTVWEDANDRGLIEVDIAKGRNIVRLTLAGHAFLEEHRFSKRDPFTF
jgi:hypothetical protein